MGINLECVQKERSKGCVPRIPSWAWSLGCQEGGELGCLCELAQAMMFSESKIAKPMASWTEKGVRTLALQLASVSLCPAHQCRPPIQS